MTTMKQSATAPGETAPAREDISGFYALPGVMTSPGQHADKLAALPNDVTALAQIVPGLSIHEYMASAYGVTIPDARKSETHIRRLAPMLDRLLAQDNRPLDEARRPDQRLVGVCNHFAVFLIGMLRAKGIPARARWGFGSYFNPPCFEDHVLTEYWSAADGRWIRVDAQLDAVFQKALKLDFDALDVPHDRFVIAGDAWVQCRDGQADPAKYGIFKGDLRGLWFIGCNLVKDVAALNKMELLPWDVWGAMPKPGATLSDEQIEFFDRLAALTRSPDTSFVELRTRYQDDDQLRVPSTVFNAQLQRPEAL